MLIREDELLASGSLEKRFATWHSTAASRTSSRQLRGLTFVQRPAVAKRKRSSFRKDRPDIVALDVGGGRLGVGAPLSSGDRIGENPCKMKRDQNMGRRHLCR